MKKTLLAVLFGATLVLGACGGGDNANDNAGNGATGNDTASVDAEQLVQSSCISCHGGNLEGRSGPALDKVGGYLSEEEIHDVIVNGKGSMPPMLKGAEAEAVAEWLAAKK